MQFDRLKLLVGDKFEDIKNKTVLIVGIGGVGGYALEALVRSGISNIIIVDNDTIDITNLNRQIISNINNIGQFKVDVAEERALSINPECNIIKYNLFLNEDNVATLFDYKIDYVVDACDTLSVKKELIRQSIKNGSKLISSMGTGYKMHPEMLEIVDIRKTEYDPIAKIIRKMVRDEKIKQKIYVIASKELPKKNNDSKTIASNAIVPSTAGILAASFILNDIVGEL